MPNKRKADDITNDDAEVSETPKMPEDEEAYWPAPPDGWNSSLGETRRLHKAMVLAQYRLTDENIQYFSFETEPHDFYNGYVHKYLERDIEKMAWQIHGGPDGLWHLLRRAREEHTRSGSKKPFLCPYEYTAGRPFDLNSASPPDSDCYVMGDRTLISIKAVLSSWFWLECNRVLNLTLRDGVGERRYGQPAHPITKRVNAIIAAQTFFNQHSARYSDRPTDPLDLKDMLAPKSYALRTIRGFLKEAPKVSADLRGTDAWGSPQDRLRFANGDYEWGLEYLAELFAKLCQGITILGLEDDGWMSIRWELYHKFAKCVDGGLRYDPIRKSWTDPAGEWLEGHIKPQSLPGTMRGRCAAGIEYNNLLLVLYAGSSQLPASSHASSRVPGLVGAPVAGPSSA